MLGLLEIGAAVVMLELPHPREAAVAVVGCLIAAVALGRVALEDDDPVAGVLLQLCVGVGYFAMRSLGLHSPPGAFEAFLALVVGAAMGAVAQRLGQTARPALGTLARIGAVAWPLAGLAVLPFESSWVISLLLFAQALHFGWLSRSGVMRRSMAIVSTIAFNAALCIGALSQGFTAVEYLLIPFGVSVLILVSLFRHEMSEETSARLRAIAVTIIYAAAAFKPLAMDNPTSLFICVLVCVIGVAGGIVTRIRSVVMLGTGFLVTTVVASLVRYGIHEPRVGAILLSTLGLMIVGFMVLITTRRSELIERYHAARNMLAQWDA